MLKRKDLTGASLRRAQKLNNINFYYQIVTQIASKICRIIRGHYSEKLGKFVAKLSGLLTRTQADRYIYMVQIQECPL